MGEIYKHSFQTLSVYGHAVALLDSLKAEPGVHVDIGCGYGAIAEPIRDMGRDYLGLDLAEDGLASLRDRGFQVATIDLSDIDGARASIRAALAGRRLTSLSMLDTLEHLSNGPAVIAMLRAEAEAAGAPLVLSVPNVAHKDLALKLLVGRWDLTEAGLLDHTHLAFYTARSLSVLMRASGWAEVETKDWLLEHSDQEFPSDLQVLKHATPLGHFLRKIVEASNPTFLVNQFVRAYRPVASEEISLLNDRSERERPFLSIILAADDAASPPPSAFWDALAEQTDSTFDVLYPRPPGKNDALPKSIRSRVRIVPPAAGGGLHSVNAALAMATGRFVTIVSGAEQLERGYVAAFVEAGRANAGSVLEVGRATPSTPGAQREVKTGFAFFDDSVAGGGAIAEFAIPASIIHDLGTRLQPDLGVFAARDLAARAIELCGVVRSQVAAVADGGGPSPDDEPDAFIRWLERLSGAPTLLPVGGAAQLFYVAKAGRDHLAAREELSARLSLMEVDQKTFTEKVGALSGEVDALRNATPQYKALFSNWGLDAARPAAPGAEVEETARPFLTIITRTQGTRTRTLRDALLSLAGQTSRDFEWLLMVHSEDPAALASAQAVVDEFPPSLTERTRVIPCRRPGRAAPLNDGFLQARGDYVCVLDDDDFVFGNYVEIFRDLAKGSPGSVLRMACLMQNFVLEDAGGGTTRPRATSWFSAPWPGEYDPVAHVHANYTPFMSVAFPRRALASIGLTFDEGLSTTEDWALTTRAIMIFGVASSADAGCVYRWWLKAESSSFVHPPEEWAANRQTIIDRLDKGPILLGQGAASRICTLIDDKARIANDHAALVPRFEQQAEILHASNLKIAALEDERSDFATRLHASNVRIAALVEEGDTQLARAATADARIEHLTARLAQSDALITEIGVAAEARLKQLLASSTWRATAPFRRATLAVTGRSTLPPREPRAEDVRELLHRVRRIEASTAWEAAGPLRSMRRVASRLTLRRFLSMFSSNSKAPRDRK